ncbi:MAG: Hint domain-containing protein [Akkermansiaceae bacterium]|nr:Hint domain-containing protein [Akkermansiaceae bacterium]
MSRLLLFPPGRFPLLAAVIAAISILSLSSCGLLGTAMALAPLKLSFSCLPESTQIDTPGGKTQAIETLRVGDLVLGYEGHPVRVLQISAYLEDAEKSVFHEITFSNRSIVDLCSMHRIEGIRANNLAVGKSLPSGLTVVETKTYRRVERSYDILTEDDGYRIGGIPVNSMIEEMYEAGHSGKIRR